MSQTLFKSHIERMSAEAEDYLQDRKTGVDCEYVNHPEGAPWNAVVIVGVDNSSCCPKNEDNTQVRVCWRCAMAAHRDQFQCACKEEDSVHKSNELTFIGEIQSIEVDVDA